MGKMISLRIIANMALFIIQKQLCLSYKNNCVILLTILQNKDFLPGIRRGIVTLQAFTKRNQ